MLKTRRGMENDEKQVHFPQLFNQLNVIKLLAFFSFWKPMKFFLYEILWKWKNFVKEFLFLQCWKFHFIYVGCFYVLLII